MGWTFTQKPHDQSVLEFFRQEWEHDDEHQSFKILDGGVVGFREFYAAGERTVKKTGEVIRFGLMCLLDYRSNDTYNFGYNDMDESMGPFYVKCPERIYKLFKDCPACNENAVNWRKNIEEYHAKRKKAKLKSGQKIRLKEPLRFTDGRTRQDLTYRRVGRRSIFEDEYGTTVRISNWKQREFETID